MPLGCDNAGILICTRALNRRPRRCRNPFISHWLKLFLQCHVTVVIQDPG